jgi:cellulose synthase/poly-beta-1,6-N-acetylglucosamine synthase-like glycosyltransferase
MTAEAPAPRITVVYLLYRAAAFVPGLVDALVRQRHPAIAEQSRWLEALFVDDGSGDDTASAVDRSLSAIGRPAHYRVHARRENVGLSRTLNEALGLVRTPYVLTCHLDCLFGRDDYVAAMAGLLDRHPRVAAITGQPAVPSDRALSFAEKVNLVANLMDIFPDPSGAELVPVGFAEGRCDAFRIEALREAGHYDTRLRTAGEDQVLASRLRDSGWEVCQAPELPYHLSVSGEQDTVARLVAHQRLFGRAHPYILLLHRTSRQGVASRAAGTNRRRRALLRLSQVASCAVYALVVAGALGGRPAWTWGGALAFLLFAKLALFARHLAAVPMNAAELLKLALVQPLLDVSYTYGLAQGLARLLAVQIGRAARP